MSLSDEIERLAKLLADGAISEAEFVAAKQRLITGQPPAITKHSSNSLDTEKNWVLGLHLSQFAGYVIPGFGLILPILIWQLKKAELPVLDPHGKVVANWLLSALIYGVCCVPLFFVGIGIVLLPVLLVLGIVFPIIGTIKAGEGIVWRYPLSIDFFK